MQETHAQNIALAKQQAESVEAVMDDYKRLLETVEQQLRQLNEAFYHAEQERKRVLADPS